MTSAASVSTRRIFTSAGLGFASLACFGIRAKIAAMSPSRRSVDNQNEQKNATRPAAKHAMPAPTAAGGRIQRAPDSAGSAAEVLALQGRVGNRAVQNLLATRQIQAKLDVGPVDDPFEQEANANAERVSRMTSSDNEELPAAGPIEEE
jgi:hypothetical protein